MSALRGGAGSRVCLPRGEGGLAGTLALPQGEMGPSGGCECQETP